MDISNKVINFKKLLEKTCSMCGETEDKCAHAGSLSPENLSSVFKLAALFDIIEVPTKNVPKDLGRMFDMDFEELE